ncbi:MarR family transcriptional regulator [Cnuibacter physcomitrellae]|uniref:MarR family winged helix-turn-helix transcriptional regulator n=1 Tax=Cnuibacter physcomitrellae TaxID=1619308 RepID=UPI00157C3933|nr:MarR family transcriptional regulator [Cnuibacter physcomitrellae]MCS5498555.1 MarR family transcriptional regulator [Cnuibacter physcomitrellae]GGI35317.1 MarR family transcriptional regulator [Cnuibacter physcomitrellae]
MAEKLSPTELALFERLIDVGKLLERRADRATREHTGIKYSQYEVLIRLRNAGGEIRMTELANKLVSTPSALTYQVSQLEKAGLVTRVVAPDDERGVLARITDEGRQMLRDVSQTQNDMIVEATIAPLSRAQVEATYRALGALQIHLRGEETGGMTPDLAPPAS